MRLESINYQQQKLISLSKRFKYLTRNNLYSSYVDKKIKSENLQFNLSLVISHIILNLNFIDRSKDAFLLITETYNKEKQTNLTFEDFEKISWIRIVRDEVVIPELVRHFIWKVGDNEKDGKSVDIPKGKNDLVRCLQIYYQKCFENSNITISKKTLDTVLSEYALKEVTIDFLVDREIIGFESKQKLYYLKGNKYSRHLGNEIASILWLKVGGENATDLEFNKYFKLIFGTQIQIGNLGHYLSDNNISKICELALLYLNNESDLMQSDAEFTKIWLDSDIFQYVDIATEIPHVEFNFDNTFDFIQSVNYHKWRYREAFDYQFTRSYCYTLLQIIITNDSKNHRPYQNVLKIFEDISRPFLVWTLYNDIPRKYPEVIPYLLCAPELAPIAFKQIDIIEIDDSLLSVQSTNYRKNEEICELKNQLWIEMFDLILEQIFSTKYQIKENGIQLTKILIDVADKIFDIKSNDRISSINHNSFRKRYSEAINVISNKRISTNDTHSQSSIKPRMIFSVLPEISNHLKKKTLMDYPSHTEFIHLSSGFVYLCLEIIRLANLRVDETEISQEQNKEIANVSNILVSLLEKHISQFNSATEIDAQIDHLGNVEKRIAKRGIKEFGFEIIDWGYLYLHYQKKGVLKAINENFKTTLDFKTDGSRYDDLNKEQFEKIKLHLKSLMLAYISINTKKDLYEIEGLPVNKTLHNLENMIKYFSLIYSVDELSKKQIDVFDERFTVFGYDIYYQPLTTLLYKCINYFKDDNQNNFIKDFFVNSIDIGRMLTAINILDSKDLRDTISKRIEEIKIEDYIESSFLITELNNALIQAINSDDHWNLAKPLIVRIQDHFATVKNIDENTKYLLYEIKLLLAFKEKDIGKIKDTEAPKFEDIHSNTSQKAENIKIFFTGLFNLCYDKNYKEAIMIFESLLSKENKNVRFAFHLYRARTLKAIGT